MYGLLQSVQETPSAAQGCKKKPTVANTSEGGGEDKLPFEDKGILKRKNISKWANLLLFLQEELLGKSSPLLTTKLGAY